MCWCWILELSFYNYSCSGIITFDLPLIANSTTVLVVVPCTVQRRVVLPVVVFAAVELTKVSTGPLGSMKKILRYDYEGRIFVSIHRHVQSRNIHFRQWYNLSQRRMGKQ